MCIRDRDEIVDDIEARISAWTFLPIENGEAIHVLHYENGQKYATHVDYFADKAVEHMGSNRVATVLMYLSDVKKGGETVFPHSEAKLLQRKDESWSECAQEGYAVKPGKGDALLFFNLHLDGTPDPKSFHGGCPVIEGEKWAATKWIRMRDVEEDGDYVDEKGNDLGWAAIGEWEVGGGGVNGNCTKSSNVCSS